MFCPDLLGLTGPISWALLQIAVLRLSYHSCDFYHGLCLIDKPWSWCHPATVLTVWNCLDSLQLSEYTMVYAVSALFFLNDFKKKLFCQYDLIGLLNFFMDFLWTGLFLLDCMSLKSLSTLNWSSTTFILSLLSSPLPMTNQHTKNHLDYSRQLKNPKSWIGIRFTEWTGAQFKEHIWKLWWELKLRTLGQGCLVSCGELGK